MNVRIFLVSVLLIIGFIHNSFSQIHGITRKNFGEKMQGVWTLSYYRDTLNKMVFDSSNFVDTLTIKKNGEVIQKRTIADGGILIFKEFWEYVSKEKKICRTSISFVMEGEEIQSKSYKGCDNFVIKMNKNEIILEWFGFLEDNPDIKTKMQSRYIRVNPRFAE